MNRRREIGRRIRNLRRTNKLTQVQLEKAMGMGKHSILDIEAGRRAVTLDEAVELAIYFNVELTYLAGITNGYQAVGA